MTTLRPMTEADLDFLARLYASTRSEEMAQVPWSAEQKADFLAFQFTAQHTHYQEHFAAASFDVVEVDGVAAGRLYVERREDEIRLIDIALLPDFRGRGIGSELLGDLIDEAIRAALPLRIHVEHNNPAMRLYQRLGFEKIDEHGVYHLMERPGRAAQESTTHQGDLQ
ncbi:MAG: GNAT family N-acetyltransferase [Pseudomonadota bacterium]